jgi:uncharacterized protein YigE (DUF2233 family)
VAAKLFALLVLCCWVSPWAAAASDLRHTPPAWRSLGPGISFTEVGVVQEGETLTNLAVVKIDPANNAFRVFHRDPRSIREWQAELNAPVVFNASYYDKAGQPVGLVISDGKLLGPLHNRLMRGMFVAEPRGMSPDLPRATILDLRANPINPRKLPWSQGVQSFPLLLDYKGNIRVTNSDKKSYRTVIAADRVGNILVFNTASRFFTLHDFARFLKASAFNIDSALNLDGGTEAQLFIKSADFEYFSPPSWETSIGTLLEGDKFMLPTVVGVFPRQD